MLAYSRDRRQLLLVTSVEIRHTADRCNALLKESKDLETEIKMLEEEEKSINAGQRALESDLSKTQLVEAELDKNTREYTEAISKLDSEVGDNTIRYDRLLEGKGATLPAGRGELPYSVLP